MILPLPRTGPSRRCRLQLTTQVRLSSPRGRPARSRRASRARRSRRRRGSTTPGVRRVVDAAVVQVAIEACVVDRVDRAEAHRHGGELPEVGHQPRVGIARQPPVGRCRSRGGMVEVVLVEATLEERAGVDARRGVALDVDVVAGVAVVLAPEEVVEAHLVERADEAKVDRWPPMPGECLVGRTTITAAFQRMKAPGCAAPCPRRRGTTAERRIGDRAC
jgi:hypothetical protein